MKVSETRKYKQLLNIKHPDETVLVRTALGETDLRVTSAAENVH